MQEKRKSLKIPLVAANASHQYKYGFRNFAATGVSISSFYDSSHFREGALVGNTSDR
jgi:hypothetical protein